MSPRALDQLEALNALLEDERASVEIAVALATGASDLREREMFTTIGGANVEACCMLRHRIEAAGVTVTPHINRVVLLALATERYAERLRAFARHQIAICDRVRETLPRIADPETRDLLRDLNENHSLAAYWCERRADDFDVALSASADEQLLPAEIRELAALEDGALSSDLFVATPQRTRRAHTSADLPPASHRAGRLVATLSREDDDTRQRLPMLPDTPPHLYSRLRETFAE